MSRASIELIAPKCTSCMLCVRECPSWCITLESHQEVVGDPGARRPRTTNVLDEFAIDWGLCMYCGICIEVCPFDALSWREEPIQAEETAEGLRHDRGRLDRSAPGRD